MANLGRFYLFYIGGNTQIIYVRWITRSCNSDLSKHNLKVIFQEKQKTVYVNRDFLKGENL